MDQYLHRHRTELNCKVVESLTERVLEMFRFHMLPPKHLRTMKFQIYLQFIVSFVCLAQNVSMIKISGEQPVSA